MTEKTTEDLLDRTMSHRRSTAESGILLTNCPMLGRWSVVTVHISRGVYGVEFVALLAELSGVKRGGLRNF